MKIRTPALVVLPIAVLLVSGCGGSAAPQKKAGSQAAVTSAPRSTTAAKPGATSSGKPGVPVTAATKSSTNAGAQSSAAQSGKPTAATATAAEFTAAGTYTYDTKGSVTASGQAHDASGTETLTVDKPVGSAQHSTLGGDQNGGSEQFLVRRGDGTYLARLKVNAAGINKDFHPAQPVLGVPKPAVKGRKWSWTMTSTDGKTTAHYTAQFVRQESVTIGGTKVDAWVIESTLTLSGDFDYTEQDTTDYDPSRLLEVRRHARISGTIFATPFTGESTSTLRSVRPS